MDSLTKKLESAEGEELVSTQLIVASRLVMIDPNRADSLVRLVMRESLENGYTENWILGLTVLGGILSNRNQRDSAELILQMAIDEGGAIGLNKGVTGAHLNYGALLIRDQEYEKAAYHHIQGYEVALRDPSLNIHALVHLMNLGIIEQTLENFENAMSCFEKALEISNRTGQEFRSAQILANMGIVAYKQKNYGQAIEYQLQAYPIFHNSKAWLDVARTMLNLGLSHFKIQQHEKALDYFDQAVEAWRNRNDERGEHLAFRYKAEVFLELRRLKEAEHMLERSTPVMMKYNEHQYLAEIYSLWAHLKEIRGEYDLALENFRKSVAYEDSVRNKTKEADLNKALAKFEIERLERENELAKQISDLQIQRQNQTIVAVAVLLALSVLGFLWNRSRLQNKLKLQELTNQIAQQEVVLKTSEFETEKERLQVYAQQLLTTNQSLQQKKEQLEQQLTEDHQRRSEIDDLLQKLRESISTENDWTAFRLYFDRAYPSFFEEFRNTTDLDLTISEQRLLSLMKINLTNKEIANALNIQRDSVVRAKIRLKEKLGLAEIKQLEDTIVNLG